MSVFNLFRSYPVVAVPSVTSTAKLAGQLLAACVMRDSGLSFDRAGWRIVIGPLVDHREMVAADLDASEPN